MTNIELAIGWLNGTVKSVYDDEVQEAGKAVQMLVEELSIEKTKVVDIKQEYDKLYRDYIDMKADRDVQMCKKVEAEFELDEIRHEGELIMSMFECPGCSGTLLCVCNKPEETSESTKTEVDSLRTDITAEIGKKE